MAGCPGCAPGATLNEFVLEKMYAALFGAAVFVNTPEPDPACLVCEIERQFEEPGAWRLKKRHDKGCANLRRKTERWLVDLVKEGCTAAVVLHDLDLNPQNGSLNNEVALRHKLEAIPIPRGFERLL